MERLYRGYRQRLYYVAVQILHDPMLAEDAVQDAFLRVRDHLDQISEEECCSLEVLEKQCGTAIQDKEENFGLEEAFQQLSFDHAEILRLRYDQCFTNSEIAKFLALPEATVRKRLSRARKNLERLLRKGEGYDA